MEMNNQTEFQNISEDEISLVEIWQILIARKWLIFIIPVITVVLAVTYLMLTKPEFGCTAHILIGQTDRGQLVKNPPVLVREIVEKYRVGDKLVANVYPRLDLVGFDKKDSGSIISLKAIDHDPEGAKIYLTNIIEEILREEKDLFEQGIQLKQLQLKTLTDQIKAFELYQIQLDKQIEEIGKQDPAQAAILAVEKGKFLATMISLQNQRYVLENSMRESEAFPAKLLAEPRLPEKPFKPKRAFVLLFAGLLGLFLGIMAAFIAEYIVKAQRQMKTNQPA